MFSNLSKMMKSLIAGTFCLSSAMCAAAIVEAPASDLMPNAVVGPRWTANQLSFTFDASAQTNATGTFTAYVTFPNYTQVSLNGTIGSGGSPVVLQIGPPSLQGAYSLAFEINTLSGTINHSQGPYLHAKNLTNGSTMNYTFNVTNVHDQNSTTFVNTNP